jgi:ethanolamine utilization protein EutQ (cupin superfamily)
MRMRFWEISTPRSSSPFPSTNTLPLAYLFFRTDTEKPISAGFYRLEPGTPLVYTYTYHEMKIIVSGDFTIADETGQKVTAVAGDVFYFPKGSVITFTTEKGGLAFYTGQRAKDAA